MDWFDRAFGELDVHQLHAILMLRAEVFVVEQRCFYQDPDAYDRVARHLWAAADGAPGGKIVAYLRVLPAGARYAEASIGRVIVAPAARGTGLGRDLMARGIAACGGPIRIAAQAYLERFYAALGFVRISENYDDDGIAHLDMLRG